MLKSGIYLLLILIASLLAVTTSHAQMQVRAESVVLAPIVEELPLSGSIISPRYSDLATQVGGMVLELRVDVGDRVEKGDVLLLQDRRITELELERLLARQDEARLAYEDATRLANEGRRLITDRNISKSQYESRLAAEAREQSRLQQLETEVSKQRVHLDRHTLRAPFSGVIGFKHTEIGEWLNAGEATLQLVQMDPLRVQVSVPERYYAEVRSGTPVTLTVDALPGKVIKTQVGTVVSSAEFNTRSFLARMDIANADYLLAPGMSAHLDLFLGGGESTPVLQVSADAIVRRGDGSAVVWVVTGDKAQPVVVRIGRRNEGSVEVSAQGLAEGMQVVTLGNEGLRPGQTVVVARR